MSESVEIPKVKPLEGATLSDHIQAAGLIVVVFGIIALFIALFVCVFINADKNSLSKLTGCEYRMAQESIDREKLVSIGDLYANKFLCYLVENEDARLDIQRNALKRPSP